MGTRTPPAPARPAALALALAAAAALASCKDDHVAPTAAGAGSAAAAGSAGSGAAGSAGSGAAGSAVPRPGAAGSAAAPASCDAVDAAIVSNLTPPDLAQQLPPGAEDRLRDAVIAACRRDAWSAPALDCAAQPAAARARCPGRLTDAQERSARSALIAEAMLALAEPLGPAGPAPAGPHPDFPTPARAGTDKLFTMIEPDRGPKAPLGMTIPRGLTWTVHAGCAADPTGPVCSPPLADPAQAGLWSWRVGRRGAVIVAEERRGPHTEATFVYVLGPGGAPRQRVRFDAYGRVDAALLFQGARYSGRLRNGGNALGGCGYHAARLDADGRVEEITCLQWQGEPMLDGSGVARTRFVRGADGFVTEELRFDLAGQPVADADGVHRTLITRDAAGRPTLERYRGVDGKPARSTQGCYGRRLERDARGALVRLVCLDAADQPAARPSGTSAEVYRVDASGCRTGVSYQSLRGTPAADHDLVHAMDYEVDERCAITSRLCRDLAGGVRACTTGGPARYVTRYDADGNEISVKHYDADGSPGEDPAFHAFELRRTYDRLGNQLTQACHDALGERVTCLSTDFHAIRSIYDDAGRELSQTYRDDRGRPAGNYGAFKRTYKYDSYDHLVETQNLDENGALTEAFGVAIRKELYDAAHRRFGILLYGRAGRPAQNPGCYTGATCPAQPWHAVRIVRRPDGTVELNQFFDADQRLLETKRCSVAPCFD